MSRNVETLEEIDDTPEEIGNESPEHNTYANAPVSVPISSLRPGDSPRLGGENAEHVQLLASAQGVPPILVHRRTMRVIDGMHRLQAAKLRGDEVICVQFFDGDDAEAYLLSVDANIKHGLPLSRSDREAAAGRILALYSHWSDRAVAAAAGLSATTVGAIRRRLINSDDRDSSRIGRDGKVRPMDASAGRLRASAVIARQPDAPLRTIAAEAGVSVGTARDVRERLRAGKDPVLTSQRDDVRRMRGSCPNVDWPSLRGNLTRDPAVRYAESGRAFIRWVDGHVIEPDEQAELIDAVPPHWRESVAELARSCAEAWLAFAQALEDRT